jgi:hypothetical protein
LRLRLLLPPLSLRLLLLRLSLSFLTLLLLLPLHLWGIPGLQTAAEGGHSTHQRS